jgi:hypothetical protein
VVTHDNYSFYNPRHHPHFDEDGGRRIYFEGTYTHTFSGNHEATPRYDYNQVMYRLDLADERLALPSPVYAATSDGRQTLVPRGGIDGDAPQPPIAFFALDRPASDAIPISHRKAPADEKATPLFYGLPADSKDAGDSTTPLFVFRSPDGEMSYSINPGWTREGWTRDAQPLCLVWRSPWTIDPWREAK